MNIDVKHLASLSRLRISEEEEPKFAVQMQNILTMVENLPALSSTDKLVDPQNPMRCRKDEALPGLKREEILKNAPQVQAGCVVVPKVIDGE